MTNTQPKTNTRQVTANINQSNRKKQQVVTNTQPGINTRQVTVQYNQSNRKKTTSSDKYSTWDKYPTSYE